MVQGRLRQQGQRIGLLLRHGRGVRHRVGEARDHLSRSCSLIQCLPRGREGSHEQRSYFRLQPSPEEDHAVLFLMDVKGTARVPPRRLSSLGPPIHAAPAAYDPLDVVGRAGARHGQQSGFGLGSSHAGQGPDLGVRDLSVRERLR